MSRRRFVREIKAKEVKNINPSDIIYLAMKDGSIILIADDDEDLIEYDDLKLDHSYKRKRKYYNKKVDISNDNSLYEFETDNNYKTNTHSYKSIENNRINSTNHSTINIVKYYNKDNNKNNDTKPSTQNKSLEKYKNNYIKPSTPNIVLNKPINIKMTKINEKEKERKNNVINYNISTYQTKNDEKLDKSYDSIKVNQNNLGYHEIEYINNSNNKSFDLYNKDSSFQDRSKSNITHHNNYIINNFEKTRKKNNVLKFDEIQKTSNHLVDISFDSNDKSILNNRRQHTKIEQRINKYKEKDIDQNKLRSHSSIDIKAKPENILFVERKEMEIMGRIVNDKNSYRNIDHNHPNTLFDPNCKFCQNVARENKLSISNIKVESIYNNYSFMASFGDSGRKGKNKNDYTPSKNYYL
jgi:hypothetical protein